MGSEDSFGLRFVNDSTTNSCSKLLQCSERAEVFEKTVFVTNWDEVRAWQAVAPMCCYDSGSISSRHRKNNKSGKKNKKNELNHNKSFLATRDFTSDNNITFPLPIRSMGSNGSISRNKFLRSVNVLSYGIPSWRFLMSSKTFNYIERHHPKDIFKIPIAVNNYEYNRGGSCNTAQKTVPRLDPALFFDEKLAASYESFKHYQNKRNQESICKIPETSELCLGRTNQYILNSTISPFKSIGEIDGNDKSSCSITKKKYLKSLNDCKHRRFDPKAGINGNTRNNLKTKKNKKKEMNKSDIIKSNIVLPIEEHLEKVKSLENITHSKTNLSKSPFLPSINNRTKSKTSKHCLLVNVETMSSSDNLLGRIQANNSNLYLPTLNYGNYKKGDNKFQQNSSKSKLPPICGVRFNSFIK